MLLLRDAHDAEARKRVIYSAADIPTFTPTHSALRTSLNFSVRPHAYNARSHLNILDLFFVLSNTPPQKLNLNKCIDIHIIYNLIANITKYKLKVIAPHLSLLSLSTGTYMVQHLLQGLGKPSKT